MENSTNHFDIIVIGNGIAAKCLLWNIAKLNKSLRVLNLFDDTAYPSCTTRTTSVVSMDVHKRGISALGDLLVDSHKAFKSFVDEEKPDGVFKAKQFYVLDAELNEEKRSQYFNRYGNDVIELLGSKGIFKDSYLIKPEALLAFMDKFIANSKLSIDKREQRVTSVDSTNVKTDEASFTCEKLLLASSAYTQFFYENVGLPKGKAVSGSYYIWSNQDMDKYFDSSTVLSKGHFNIIYRRENKELLFGGTSKEGFIYEHHLAESLKEYTKLKSFFSGIEFPDVDKARVFTGIRHKGKKRMPFAGKVEDGVYAMTSLYKNGFSFPFFGSKLLVKEIFQEI